MENASKALIIAGAILLSILIIVLGIYFFNQSSNSARSAQDSWNDMDVQAFNSQLRMYMGNKVYGFQAKELIQKVISLNKQFPDDVSSCIYVNVYYSSNPSDKSTHKWKVKDLRKLSDTISDKSFYKVYVTSCTSSDRKGGYLSNGYIGCISIKKF